MSGWNDLGELLAGGLETRKENAFQQGRYRSAQTEDALMQARMNQAKALQAEQENSARSELAAMQARGDISYTDPTSQMITQALLGGLGKDLPNASGFNLGAQEYRNRAVLGDENASARARLRAGEAVQGKVQGDLQSVGSKGYYNLTDEVPELAVMAGLDAGSNGVSSPIQIFKFRKGLTDPADVAQFNQDVRADKMVNAGGVTYSVPGVNPNGVAPRAVVSRDETAANAAAVQGAKTTATTQSKLANSLPGVVESLDTFTADIDRFLESPGFDMVYGKSGAAAAALGPLAPEDYRNANAILVNLGSQAFTNTIQKLRGLGSLSNAEGAKFESALSSAMDRNQDEKQAAESFKLLKSRLIRFRQVAEIEAGLQGVPGVTGQPRSFATEAEAVAAGVQPGERVIIGGVSGMWE